MNKTNLRAMVWILIACGVLFRISLAVAYIYLDNIIPQSTDAVKFYINATLISENFTFDYFSVGFIYSYFLALLIFIFGDVIFIAHIFSILAWLVSAIYFNLIINLIEVSKTKSLILNALYSFLPASAFYTSIILRESYQLMFFTMAIYYAILYYFNNNFKNFIAFIIYLIFFAILHGALIYYSFILLLFFNFLILRNKNYQFFLIILYVLYFIILYFNNPASSGIYYANNDIFDHFINQRNLLAEIDGRSNYYILLENNSFFHIVLYLINIFLYYMLEPLFSGCSNFLDFFLLIDNLIRFSLFTSIFLYLNAITSNRRLFIFLLIAYISIEFFWSLGTSNWGTASRHHVVGSSLLLILFSIPLMCNNKANNFVFHHK